MNILKSKFFLIFPFVFIFTSCSDPKPDYSKMARSIVANYIKDFAQPKGLSLYSYGGAMMYDIQKISLSFYCYENLNIDEARILYIDFMKELLCRINCNEEIRPYLHVYPFGIDNIDLTITFVDSECHMRNDGQHVAYMYIGKNQNIVYKSYDSNSASFCLLLKEPYNQAFQQVISR